MITLIAIHGSQVFHVASRDPKAGPLCGRGKDSAVQQHFLPGDDAGRATFHKRRACVGCSKKLAQQLVQAEELAHAFAPVPAVTEVAVPSVGQVVKSGQVVFTVTRIGQDSKGGVSLFGETRRGYAAEAGPETCDILEGELFHFGGPLVKDCEQVGRCINAYHFGCVGQKEMVVNQDRPAQAVGIEEAHDLAQCVENVVGFMATYTPESVFHVGQDDTVTARGLADAQAVRLVEQVEAGGYRLTDKGLRAAGVAAMVSATNVMAKALLSGSAEVAVPTVEDVAAMTGDPVGWVSAMLVPEGEVTADLKAKGLVFGAVRPAMPQDAGDRRCPVKLDPRSADDTEPWIVVNEDGSPVELDTADIEAGVYVTRFAHFEVDPCATIEQAVYAHLPHNFAELDAQLNAQQRTMIDGATAVEVHGEDAWIAAENLANVGSLAELVSLGLAYRSSHSVHGHHYLTQAGRNLATYRRVFVSTGN